MNLTKTDNNNYNQTVSKKNILGSSLIENSIYNCFPNNIMFLENKL